MLKIKLLSLYLLDNYKSILVALGYLLEIGVDFYGTFNSSIIPTIIRLVLSLTLDFGWKLSKFDVNNTFLNDDLEEIVYMRQPVNFEKGNGSVCKLKKVLCGLK